MDAAAEKIGVIEKLGFSFADLGANLIFQTMVTFLAFFYTDVYKLSASTTAWILMTGGIIGAVIFTPLIGLMADRTVTKWGKFRPWLIWTSLPFGLIVGLTFTSPDLSGNGRVAYAFGTYLLLLLIYAANNIPYSALSGVITGNMGERNSLSSYRFTAVMIAQLIVQVLLLPMALILGEGDKVVGFHKVMIIFSVLGVISFVICFLTTRERVQPIAIHKSSVSQDFQDLRRNQPWLIMMIVTILIFTCLSMKGGLSIYYFTLYLDANALQNFLATIGFTELVSVVNKSFKNFGISEVSWPSDPVMSAFGIINACGIFMMIGGIVTSKFFADLIGKRNVFAGSLALSTLFLTLIYLVSPVDIYGYLGLQLIQAFIFGVSIPLLWAMISDVADYSEWRNKRRSTAIIFSAILIGLKIGLTIGGSLVAATLAFYNYDVSLPIQTLRTSIGIKDALSIYASAPLVLATFCLIGYKIDKSLEFTIERDLRVYRKAHACS